jgi:formate-dependent phosphoribosylglycinamide formyltransferase (GAR transformylase)
MSRPTVGPAVTIVNAMVEQGYVPEDHALGHIAVFAITALEAAGYSVVPTSQAKAETAGKAGRVALAAERERVALRHARRAAELKAIKDALYEFKLSELRELRQWLRDYADVLTEP